jgi:hypothetical protein
MVYNIVSHHSLPFRSQTMKGVGKHSQGQGMGSLLLNKGGAGGASSYIDIDDYIDTTGRNPYKSDQHAKGKGFEKLSSKLSNLKIEPSSTIKRKNIVM